ncbi:MAG: ATP-binding protein [Armatimonadota bacterium]|nr:ATP-binding protein [Armatimonadota bacterium]MDR5696793.1 ATP-binding protein [Armatimonadota bacterium]
MTKGEDLRVAADRLRWVCRPEYLRFGTTADLPPERSLVGQDRAVRALDFGLSIRQPQFHVFVVGPAGTGRTTYTEAKVREVAARDPTPPDWCYVYNFRSPGEPVALRLPPGEGRRFVAAIATLVDDLRQAIRKVLTSEQFEALKRQTLEGLEAEANRIWQQLDAFARQKGFLVQRGPVGITTVPLGSGGQPMSQEEFDRLPGMARERLAQANREVQEEIAESVRRVRAIERQAREAVATLERNAVLAAIRDPIQRLRDRYRDHPDVVAHLDAMQEDVVENSDAFREDEQPPQLPLPIPLPRRSVLERYEVNLLVDNSDVTGAPVVFERNPSYYNLFGKVEYRGELGAMVTDFRMIRPGALHRANGGYLILNARDLLLQPASYDALKRALRSGDVRIENLSEVYGLIPTATLRPQPIPLRVKVVLIGPPELYYPLHRLDDDFRKMFRVKAEFDTEMPRTEENMQRLAAVLGVACTEDGLRPCDRTGVARILEYSARLAGSQEKLSTRFAEIKQLLVEAAAWAERDGAPAVSAAHVQRALEEKVYRSRQLEEKIQDAIRRGQLFVDTDGATVGQINGISVWQVGDYAFGRPNRITARAFVGARGVVNIEREINLSGPIHSKGVLILSGYLGGKYALHRPLSLSATLTFEQTYEEVEGDSASSAELYALLSVLADLPIAQGIAVTGSVNQRGEIQPIGGVNEKIEGFYAVCKVKGLTGRQGVLIPHSNAQNLMLREEVVEAVREGQFHIWAVWTIDEGIEILTGVPAGDIRPDGSYPEGTVHQRVLARLDEFAERMRRMRPSREQEREPSEREPNAEGSG